MDILTLYETLVKSAFLADELLEGVRPVELNKKSITKIVTGSLNLLTKKNPKIKQLFYDKVLEDSDFNTKKQKDLLSGMYQAIIDYALKNNATVKQTIGKNLELNVTGRLTGKSLKDYKNSGKSIIWKLGYAVIQYEISNKSSKRLRLYAKLFMSSKDSWSNVTDRMSNWTLSDEEKLFLKYFLAKLEIDYKKSGAVADTIETTQTSDNVNQRRDNGIVVPPERLPRRPRVHQEDNTLNTEEDNSNISIPENLAYDANIVNFPEDFVWPFDIYALPKTYNELAELISRDGYDDDDLEMSHHSVFTKGDSEMDKIAVGLLHPKNTKDGYLYLVRKNEEHYWDPLMLITDKGDKTIFVKYDFSLLLSDNIRPLLMQCPADIFPLKIK